MNFSLLRTLQPIEWLLVMLLLIAPFYFHPNIGGTGLRIPNNIMMWLVASLIGFYSMYKAVIDKVLYLPQHFILIILFPVLAFFSGVISGVEIASQWVFRLLYIWGGVLIFFSLFQYKLKQGRLDRLLFIVVIAAFIHAIAGISQIVWLKNLPAWLPININGVPTGFFQQINNQASFQVTGIIVALWLVSRPYIRKGPNWRFIFISIALFCSIFVVAYSGSRVGALGFILAVPLILISRWQWLKRDLKRCYFILAVIILSISSASIMESNRGLTSAMDKATAMNSGFSGSARLGIYDIALDVIKEKPLFGHGIGSFVRVWQLGKPAFYAEHPNAILPNQRVAHPHNEIIFWLVEGGVVVGLGLLTAFIAVVLTLKKLPPSRRYAYLALLIPITLHSQVELPFYISANHWFVFLILLFVIMQPFQNRYQVNLSGSATSLMKVTALVGVISAISFLSHTLIANLEFKRYVMKQVPQQEEPFPVAMQNPYFSQLATHTVMISLLHSSIKYGLDDNVRLFADWAEIEVSYNPHILFYTLLVRAHLHLKQQQQACTFTKQGQSIYPDNDFMNEATSKCIAAGFI